MDTIPYRGVLVERGSFPGVSEPLQRWRCGSCGRSGRWQSWAQATLGKERHEQYHAAQAALAAKQRQTAHIARLFNGEGD